MKRRNYNTYYKHLKPNTNTQALDPEGCSNFDTLIILLGNEAWENKTKEIILWLSSE